MRNTYVVRLDCPDQVGLVARLTGFIADLGGNFLEVHQFTDRVNGWFFTRMEIDADSLSLGEHGLREQFAERVRDLQANWTLRTPRVRKRMVVMVSRIDHCMEDLFYRWRSGELPVDIPLVVSNHPDLEAVAKREGIPFEQVPVNPKDKEPAFRKIASLCDKAGADVVVLARYMQILPNWFCEKYAGRVINIHHSFLPAFVGANPYRRAYDRGVKLIGATCHYATSDLDEGPIIDQEVVRVEHFHQPDDLLRLGRDCERLALARGVRFHVDDRVLIHGRRTVVFRD